jgi:hypothetical protein
MDKDDTSRMLVLLFCLVSGNSLQAGIGRIREYFHAYSTLCRESVCCELSFMISISSWENLQILIRRAPPQSILNCLHTVVVEEQCYQPIVLNTKRNEAGKRMSEG